MPTNDDIRLCLAIVAFVFGSWLWTYFMLLRPMGKLEASIVPIVVPGAEARAKMLEELITMLIEHSEDVGRYAEGWAQDKYHFDVELGRLKVTARILGVSKEVEE